jgi:hypothetical protein
MPGFVPGIHVLAARKARMAGSSPAMMRSNRERERVSEQKRGGMNRRV